MASFVHLQALQTLFVRNLDNLTNRGLGSLAHITTLHALTLDGQPAWNGGFHISDLTPLSGLTSLRTLSLLACGVTDLHPLSALPLSELRLVENKTLSDLSPLRGMLTLRSLFLQDCAMIADEAVETLSSLTELRTLDLSHCERITSTGLHSLSALKSLTELCVRATQLDDQGLHVLCRSLHLEDLRLSECDITDQGLEALGSQTSLRVLELIDCDLSDLAPLARLTSLQTLILTGCDDITVEGLHPLSELVALEELNLRAESFTEACLPLLSPLIALRVLKLHFNLNDASLLTMPSLTSLQKLSINKQVTDSGLRSLSRLTGLQILDLSDCDAVTDNGLAELASLTALHTMNLSGLTITDRGFSALTRFTLLRSLNLSNCSRLTAASFGKLSSVVALENLDISGCLGMMDGVTEFPPLTRLRTFVLRGVATHPDVWLELPCTAMRKLDLSTCPNFGDASLLCMSHVPALQVGLEVLMLSQCRVTPVGLRALSTLTGLREIDLSYCKHVLDAHVEALSTLPLHVLNVDSCTEITDEGLNVLSTSSTLSFLCVSNCDLITDQGLQALRNSPSLKHLKITHCDRLTHAGSANFPSRIKLQDDGCFGRRGAHGLPLIRLEPNSSPAQDLRANEALRLELLNFGSQRCPGHCFFVRTTAAGRVFLWSDSNPGGVVVDVVSQDVDWSWIAWCFAEEVEGVHFRWYFFRSLDQSIRVHARPLDVPMKQC
jgi:hypothetical protein